MHMADALLSPAVGGSFWAASAGVLAWCSGRVKADLDDRRVPLMGVLGSFIFAIQMINFTIPGTGSSGHLGGGLLLAILLGPAAALLTIASVLLAQALFFADGGLLALGCNLFNLGIFPCLLAYPLIYRRLVGPAPSLRRIAAGSTIAAIFGLQCGALAVVAETVLSGRSELPFVPFALLMLPIHLALGLVEGGVTAIIVGFLWKSRPEIVAPAAGSSGSGRRWRPVLVALAVAALFTGSVLSWFASSRPDGLEWSLQRLTGGSVPVAVNGPAAVLQRLQEKISFLPAYSFRPKPTAPGVAAAESAGRGPGIDAGASLSGLLGGTMTLGMAGLAGLLLKRRRRSAGSG